MNTIVKETGTVWYTIVDGQRVALTVFEGSLIIHTPAANYTMINGRLQEIGLINQREDVFVKLANYGGTD